MKAIWNRLKYLFIGFFFVFCTNKKTIECKDQGIKIVYLSDLDKLIKNGYKCDTAFNDFGISRLETCKVLFSDSNYKVLYNGYKTRLLFDKKENLKLAINSVAPDFRIIESKPYALFVLDDKLMPVYAIAKLGEDHFSVYKIAYKNNVTVISKATNKESQNINVNTLTYDQIIVLISQMKNTFTYKFSPGSLDDYFYDVPFWTEGLQ